MKNISYLFNENSHFQNENNNSLKILKSFFNKKNFKKVKDVLEIKGCELHGDKYIIKVVILKSEKNKEFTKLQQYIIDQKELNTFYNREDKFINILD